MNPGILLKKKSAKLENSPSGLPKVVSGPPKWEKRFGGRRVLVATPLLVDRLIRKVGEGKLITIRLSQEIMKLTPFI